MSDKPKKLSDTARELLAAAATREDLLIPRPKLPTVAAGAVAGSLTRAGFAEYVTSSQAADIHWWTASKADGGKSYVLRATPAGLAAAGVVMPVQDAATGGTTAPATTPATDVAKRPERAPVPAGRADALRKAAHAVIEVWEDTRGVNTGRMDGAIDDLRAALVVKSAPPATARTPRAEGGDTKQSQVIALLRRPAGASNTEIATAMGWAPHTVRGFFAGLAKKGIKVELVERVRQVGGNRQGAKGSYSIYRIADTEQQ